MRHLTLIQGGKKDLPKARNVIVLKTHYDYDTGTLSIVRSGPNTHIVIAQFQCTRPCLVLYFEKLLNSLIKTIPDEIFLNDLELDLKLFFSDKEKEALGYPEDKTFFFKKADKDFNNLLKDKFESMEAFTIEE